MADGYRPVEAFGGHPRVGGPADRKDAPVQRFVGALPIRGVEPNERSVRAAATMSSPSFQPAVLGASESSSVTPKLRRSIAATLKPHS
jgi:hypothetical protein